MDNLDEQVVAVVQRYMDQNKSLTTEGIKMALPSVDEEEIEGSLRRLQQEGHIMEVPLNVCIPNIKKKA